MSDIEKAIEILHAGNYTCVLCKGDSLHISELRGVAPMISVIDSGTDVKGYSAADKVVGKAVAMLFCHAGITEIYAEVMSRSAAKFLCENDIPFTYGALTDKIINRKGDGICPMEQATAEVSDTAEAVRIIKKKLYELRKENEK